jgi:putative acetyltransferase
MLSQWPKLRPATNADCEPVRDLVYTVLGEYHLQSDPDFTDADLRDLEQSYFNRGGVFYVLEAQNGSLIGSYGLYPIADCGLRIADSNRLASPQCRGPASSRPQPLAKSRNDDAMPDTCELRKMYLRRDCRGRGYGKRLLEHALAQARERGFRRITLETASVLKEAIRLYQSYGFVPYTPAHLSPRCDQAYMLELE